MFYFIPAWYLKGEWKESEQLWYRRRTVTETDDTVKQIQLFQRNPICEYEILLLSYAPNFRHFLHRQSAFRAPYWSVFDAIQEVRRKKQAMLSFHNLNWPKEIEFVYTPFSVIAMLHRERYAKIEFGEYGNPIQVDLYRGGLLNRQNIYDDRGFVSCTSIYENGEKLYEQYLTDKGVWKLCHFADGHVAVNPRSNQYLIRTDKGEESIPFQKSSYASMEEVIGEVFASYLKTTQDTDIFCAAAHERHMALLDRLLADRRTVFSVFGGRISLEGNGSALRALSHGDCIVTDSEENRNLLERQDSLKKTEKVNIPPYDTRVDPGISQQMHVQKILFPVDHLSAGVLEEAVKYLAAYLTENHDARVHLFTRNASFEREDILLRQVSEALRRNGYPPEWARKGNTHQFEFLLDDEDQIPILFTVEQCVDDLSVNKCMREQRLLVDLADMPDLFLQISCVSMGIPQILRCATQYMRPGKNGRINGDLSRLGEDLAYYLESLRNWNQAMIQSYELGKSHTTQYLIEQWKGVIARIEYNTSITAGK
ncbi:MAG: accessory Sec system protein Asp1 [bacterium]|nr:accessory Sec system protein Asp1 [bacterium]